METQSVSEGNPKTKFRLFSFEMLQTVFRIFYITFVSKSFCTNSKTVLGTLSVRIFRFGEQRFHFCCSFWANLSVPKTKQNVCEIRCESTKKKQIVRKRTKRTEHSLKPFLILWISASKFLDYKTAVTLRQRILLFLCFLFVLVSLSPFGSKTTLSKSHLTIVLLGSEKQKENIKIFEYSNSWVSVDKCQRVESIKVVLQRQRTGYSRKACLSKLVSENKLSNNQSFFFYYHEFFLNWFQKIKW